MQSPSDPSLWAKFAAAALTGLIAEQQPHDDEGRPTLDKSHKGLAAQAASYADALSVEWARRFLQEVK